MLTVADAAEELGITPRQVRKYIADKRLKATKAGRDWDIDRRSLRALAAKERKPGRRPGRTKR